MQYIYVEIFYLKIKTGVSFSMHQGKMRAVVQMFLDVFHICIFSNCLFVCKTKKKREKKKEKNAGMCFIDCHDMCYICGFSGQLKAMLNICFVSL